MLASISPQTKAHAANMVTGSLGLSTLFQYLPTILGIIATCVGIALSVFLTYKARQQLKMGAERHEAWRIEEERNEEKHALEMEVLRKQLTED
jgi:hypothetical protein